MPLPPRRSNFYDNEDDEYYYGKRKGKRDTPLHRHEPIIYPDTAEGRTMRDKVNRGYHPDSPKAFVHGATPAERDIERSKKLTYLDDE